MGGARQLIKNGLLQSNLDANGFHIINLALPVRTGNPVNLLDYADRNTAADQTASVQEALDAAEGGALYVPEGTWWFGSSANIPSNTEIIAEPGAIFKPLPTVGYFGLLTINGKTNVSIRGLTIDGNVANADIAAFFVYDSSNILIEGCTVQNTRGFALSASTNIVNLRVNGCRFYRTGNPGDDDADTITLWFSEDVAGNSRNVFVTNNIFDSIGLNCMSFKDFEDVLITGNRLKIGNDGFLYVEPGASKRFRIIGNHSEATGLNLPPYSNGLDLNNLSGAVIEGNILHKNGGCGIGLFNCSDIIVEGNICQNNHQDAASVFSAGIWIRNNEETSSNIVLDNNICNDTQDSKTQGYGLVYDPLPGLEIGQGNVFSGNLTADIGVTNGTDTTIVSTRAFKRTATSITLANDWVAFGGSNPSPLYTRSFDGWVQLFGLLKDGDIPDGTPIGQLAADCYPNVDLIFVVATGTGTAGPDLGTAHIVVKTTGALLLYNADANAQDSLSLSAIRFPVPVP